MVPPAELSARLSAAGAETGMRRYNVHVMNIIPHLLNLQKFFISKREASEAAAGPWCPGNRWPRRCQTWPVPFFLYGKSSF